jgi:3-hydroxyacyl-[acyl-carrier-protein] dehydratase
MARDSVLMFDADHPAFAGHFPGTPIVPGVLLLDAALHALGGQAGRDVTGIASAKFLRPVGPGEVLAMAWSEAPGGRFEITSGAHRAATGTLTMDGAP